jgi:hypothetical protein
MADAGEHYIYQRLHTLGGKALHLAEHLSVASRAFEQIYGHAPEIDEPSAAALIAETLRAHRVPSRAGATVLVVLTPDEEPTVEFERRLLTAGYAHSALRPRAVTYEYSIPFPAFPTSFQLSAQSLFDSLALGEHGATRSVRREGKSLLACGDAPLFAIQGKVLLTPALTEGAMDSIERRLVLEAASEARLTVCEEPILHSKLKSLDELFFADAAGITSLSDCDGAKFMSLSAPRLAAALR